MRKFVFNSILLCSLLYNTTLGEVRKEEYTNPSQNGIGLIDSKTDQYRELAKFDRNKDGKFDLYQETLLRSNMYQSFAGEDSDFDGTIDYFKRCLKDISNLEGIEYESTARAYLFLINDPTMNLTSARINITFSYDEDFYFCKEDGKLKEISTRRSDRPGKLTYVSEHKNGHATLDSVNGNKPTEEQSQEFLEYQKTVEKLKKQKENLEKEIDSFKGESK